MAQPFQPAPYVYRGPDRDYHYLGRVTDGDVGYFQRPPDGNWHLHDGDVDVTVDAGRAANQDAADATSDATSGGELKQPNKAASAADWQAYAQAHGGFEAATGKAPAEATRKEIVEHYTNQPAGDTGQEGTDGTAGTPPADTTQE